MMSSISQRADRSGALRRVRWQMRAVAIGMAVVANVVILSAGRVINGEYPIATVGDDDQAIGFAQVIVVTILVGAVAWGILALLERITSRAATIWLGIATVVFLLSLFGPFGSGENTSSKIVLALIHLGSFMTIVPMMWRSALLPRA